MPNRYSVLSLPNIFQLSTVEKAKKNKAMAMKAEPTALPRTLLKAVWARLDGLSPSFSGERPAPTALRGPPPAYMVTMMTRAVMVTTLKVPMNTPTMATQPWSWGRFTLARAWAWGVEPMPASLANSPRLAPRLTAALRAAPAEPPKMA